MMSVLDWVLWLLLVVALIPVSVLFIQVAIAALLPSVGVNHPNVFTTEAGVAFRDKRPRLAVLVPAHNEAAGIAKTLANIAEQLGDTDRLMVVADNCTDGTDAVARAAGAEVVIRHDLQLRGKGYALDFGVRYLKDDPPDIVVVVDADCFLKDGALDRLAETVVATGRPAQALYRMLSPESGPRQLAEFAWIIKNKVRPLGFWRLGLPCQLMGTGMAFPWSAIERAPLASGHIVEDLKLGLDLARKGLPPVFCPKAEVISYFPANEEGVVSQRKRWEHGHLGMITGEAPRMLASGIVKGDINLIAVVLDLCVPPLALLTILTMFLFVVSILALMFESKQFFIFASVLLTGLASSIFLAWLRFARETIDSLNFFDGIDYLANKIPLYFKFFVDRQEAWVRSKRDSE